MDENTMLEELEEEITSNPIQCNDVMDNDEDVIQEDKPTVDKVALETLLTELESTGMMSRQLADEIHEVTGDFYSTEAERMMYTQHPTKVLYDNTITRLKATLVSLEVEEAASVDLNSSGIIAAEAVSLTNTVFNKLTQLIDKHNKETNITQAATYKIYKKLDEGVLMVTTLDGENITYKPLADIFLYECFNIKDDVPYLKEVAGMLTYGEHKEKLLDVAKLHAYIVGLTDDPVYNGDIGYTFKDVYKIVTLSKQELSDILAKLQNNILNPSEDKPMIRHYKLSAITDALRAYIVFLESSTLLEFLKAVTIYVKAR